MAVSQLQAASDQKEVRILTNYPTDVTPYGQETINGFNGRLFFKIPKYDQNKLIMLKCRVNCTNISDFKNLDSCPFPAYNIILNVSLKNGNSETLFEITNNLLYNRIDRLAIDSYYQTIINGMVYNANGQNYFQVFIPIYFTWFFENKFPSYGVEDLFLEVLTNSPTKIGIGSNGGMDVISVDSLTMYVDAMGWNTPRKVRNEMITLQLPIYTTFYERTRQVTAINGATITFPLLAPGLLYNTYFICKNESADPTTSDYYSIIPITNIKFYSGGRQFLELYDNNNIDVYQKIRYDEETALSNFRITWSQELGKGVDFGDTPMYPVQVEVTFGNIANFSSPANLYVMHEYEALCNVDQGHITIIKPTKIYYVQT